jgi:hypothetical protein
MAVSHHGLLADSALVGGSLTKPGGKWKVYAGIGFDTTFTLDALVFIDEHPASINDGVRFSHAEQF